MDKQTDGEMERYDRQELTGRHVLDTQTNRQLRKVRDNLKTALRQTNIWTDNTAIVSMRTGQGRRDIQTEKTGYSGPTDIA